MKKIMYAETASCGTCRAIEMMTQRTAPQLRMSVLTLRSCDGANSRRSQASHPRRTGRASRNVALILLCGRTLENRHRRCTHPEQIGVRIFHFDPHRETLCDPDPV